MYRAHDDYFRRGGSPGRGAHQLALAASTEVFNARLNVARLLQTTSPERVLFTPGCTYAINAALSGRAWQPGEIVLVSALEHNAVMRPLRVLEQKYGVIVHQIPYCAREVVAADELRRMLQECKPSLCAVLEASNVTGHLLNLPLIDAICKEANVSLLVDAAQSAGLFHAELADLSVSYWCTAGHKGLMGAPGAGILYVANGVDLEPLIAGGTGSRSEQADMPQVFPDRHEAGTLPGACIAALGAGAAWLLEQDRSALAAHEVELVQEFVSRLRSQPRVIFSAPQAARHVGLVSFSIAGIDSAKVAEVLDREFGVCVRSGLHCAAAAHRTLGTLEQGLVRVSFGCFSTIDDVELACQGVSELLKLN